MATLNRRDYLVALVGWIVLTALIAGVWGVYGMMSRYDEGQTEITRERAKERSLTDRQEDVIRCFVVGMAVGAVISTGVVIFMLRSAIRHRTDGGGVSWSVPLDEEEGG